LVGPRAERLGSNYKNTVPGHSLPLTAVGGIMVVVGMVAKVVGLNNKFEEVGQLAANSLISGAGGGVVAMSLFKVTVKRTVKYSLSGQGNRETNKNLVMANSRWSYLTAYNGVLTGLVSVCGTGSSLPTWAALLSGLVGGLAYFMLSLLLRVNKVDDPVSGVAVNLSGGVVGALVTGLAHMVETHEGMVVGWQLVGVVVVSAWVVIIFLVVMLPLLICGKLRIKDSQEKLGMDCVKVFEQAYSFPIELESRSSARLNVQTGGACMGADREKPPVCAFVTPNIRDQQMTANHLTSTCKVNPCDTFNNSSMDTTITIRAPQIVLERPSPATSLQSLIPTPPQFPGSGSESSAPVLAESSLTVPEISVTASNTSQDNSQTPLLSTSGTDTHSLAVDVKELRAALKQQKERLKVTNSLLRTSTSSIGSDRSDISVKSEVVRQTAKTASNKENFNYLAGTKKVDGDDSVIDNTENLDDISQGDESMGKHSNATCSPVRTEECVNESVKVEGEFDYSKKDIDDGLAQVSHVEEIVIEDVEVFEGKNENANPKESTLI